MDCRTPFNFILLLLILTFFIFTSCNGQLTVRCLRSQKDALLAFKQGLVDPSGRLSSWIGNDCCSWQGIECDNLTGTVVKIHLRNPFPISLQPYSMTTEQLEAYKMSCLGGQLVSSLLHLSSLRHLDLSLNDFEGLEIPVFLGELKNLRYLNLSYASFAGQVPPNLGNLSSLNYLDIYAGSYTSSGNLGMEIQNPSWLSGLTSLKHLNLGLVTISSINAQWLHAVNMIPSLLELHLPSCGLQDMAVTLSFLNFTSLSVLDLSQNNFNSSIPAWLSNLTSLTKLDLNTNSFSGSITIDFGKLASLEDLHLSLNNFSGPIPLSLGNLCKLKKLRLAAATFIGDISDFLNAFSGCSTVSLEMLDLNSNDLIGKIPDSIGLLKKMKHLDLAYNSLWGSIPATIGDLSALEFLYFHSNQMNGSIPESFGQLSELRNLNLNSNSWQGIITEVHLMNLNNLESLMLSTRPPSSLVFKVDPMWVPPFRLDYIQVEDCTVGPHFSTWLQVQTRLTQVKLQNVGISDTIPEEWFSQLSSQLIVLDLSDNQITGKLPVQLYAPKLETVDIASNRFEGSVPRWSTNATQFYLHENLFSGPIPQDIGTLMPRLRNLHLSDNSLNGTIPSSICKMADLQVVSLRNNHLSGELPDCWEQLSSLWVVDVSNNNLSGKIPSSMGLMRTLGMLLLSENNLDGEIPSSLQNLSALTSIDLGENQLSGEVPWWIGEKLSATFVLRLRSNKFHGQVPESLCNLQLLHFLDISHNNLSGGIPKCLHNLTSMVYGNSSELYYRDFQFRMAYFKEETTVVTKGRAYDYNRNIALLNVIDLSENNLTGPIPDEMTKLLAVRVLNLSSNHISGGIPEKLGGLKDLETLDLSHNQLSGEIPTSLSSLTFLTNLVLSYNNFSGKIPTGSQLQTFDASSYEGNPFLCGFPSPVNCTVDRTTTTPSVAEPEDETDKDDDIFELGTGLYISIALGFVIGFSGLCVTLLRKEFMQIEEEEW
ncbi:Receptor-like protein EIX2 [Linum grandiflorum]